MTDADKRQIDKVLKTIPGYDPWSHAEKIGAWIDYEEAVKAINWFADHLQHVKGDTAGQPFVLRPWQAAIVGNLFGWKRRNVDGKIIRRYRKCLLVVARGNGKTPLAAGIVLYSYFNDCERAAENYLAAGQREQAGKLFEVAAAMIKQDAELKELVTIREGDQYREIKLIDDTLSFIKVIPAEAAGQHGGIPHVTVLDELHVQDSRALVDVVETAMSKKARTQPLFLMITTADEDRPSICNEVHEHARKVRDNGGDESKPGFDPTFLPVIYEAEPQDDWKDERTWIKANPNIDVSVSLDGLREACRKAQEQPAFEPAFKQLHLNMKTTSSASLINLNQWDACEDKRAIQPHELIGKPCFGGLDLASTEDLASFALVFPLEADWIAILSYSWCPEMKVAFRATQRVPYDQWALNESECLTATSGDSIDYVAIREKINELAAIYDIREIGVDPHNARQLSTQLRDEDGLSVIDIPQTPVNLSDPTKDLLRRIKKLKVAHFGNPVLRWAAGNVSAYYKGRIPVGDRIENHLEKLPIMPSKQKSKDKIDPIAATVNAIARMLVGVPETTSVYETRGLTTI